MIIRPEVIVTPDCPTIKFRESKEQVDLSVELPKILHTQGWGCGTYFHVQFISHDKSKLLSSALFVVTDQVESLQTNEANPYQPVTKTIFNHKAERIGEWWVAESEDKEVMVATPHQPESAPEVVRRRGRPPKSAAAQQPA